MGSKSDDNFKPEDVEFSTDSEEEDDEEGSEESETGSDKSETDDEFRSSEEDQILSMFDKKKGKNDAKKPETISDYMRKIDKEDKRSKKMSEEFEAKLGFPKKKAMKKPEMRYKSEDLMKMSSKALPKFDSETDSSDDDSDLELAQFADKISKMNMSKGKPKETSQKKTTLQPPRDAEMKRKLAEMKKLVGKSKDGPFVDEHLAKAKQRLSNWMKEEEAKTAPLRDRLNKLSKFPQDKDVKEAFAKNKSLRNEVDMADLGETLEEIRKTVAPSTKIKKSLKSNSYNPDEVFSLMRDVEAGHSLGASTSDRLAPFSGKKATIKKTVKNFPSKMETTKLTAKPEPSRKSGDVQMKAREKVASWMMEEESKSSLKERLKMPKFLSENPVKDMSRQEAGKPILKKKPIDKPKERSYKESAMNRDEMMSLLKDVGPASILSKMSRASGLEPTSKKKTGGTSKLSKTDDAKKYSEAHQNEKKTIGKIKK